MDNRFDGSVGCTDVNGWSYKRLARILRYPLDQRLDFKSTLIKFPIQRAPFMSRKMSPLEAT